MIPVAYESENLYIMSCQTREAKIAAIDAIIDALFAQQLQLATQTSPQQEYILNDGQTTIKVIYTTQAAINNAINVLETMRNRYINKGRRVYRGVDIKNFIGRNRF